MNNYRCSNCGFDFQLKIDIPSKQLAIFNCPKCAKQNIKKINIESNNSILDYYNQDEFHCDIESCATCSISSTCSISDQNRSEE